MFALNYYSTQTLAFLNFSVLSSPHLFIRSHQHQQHQQHQRLRLSQRHHKLYLSSLRLFPLCTMTSNNNNNINNFITANNQNNDIIHDDLQPTEFVILGSGVSTGIPRISCIIRPDDDRFCHVCHHALHIPNSRNRRCNVSALVRTAGKTVLIDCGKTIREASMRHFPTLNVRNVDAIVLTHGHADAILGLDDARDIQLAPKPIFKQDGSITWPQPTPTPVFLHDETMQVCRNVFPYLMSSSSSSSSENKKKQDNDNNNDNNNNFNNNNNYSNKNNNDNDEISQNSTTKISSSTTTIKKKKPDIKRRVSALKWNVFTPDQYYTPFQPVPDTPIEFTPIPMFHGGDYICMGYLISLRPPSFSSSSSTSTSTSHKDETIIAYLSDLNELPERSLQFLKRLPKIDLLVVDLLLDDGFNGAHFTRRQAIDCVRTLRPKQAVAVGMTCSLGLHDEVNASLQDELQNEGLSFRLAYDGERFPHVK